MQDKSYANVIYTGLAGLSMKVLYKLVEIDCKGNHHLKTKKQAQIPEVHFRRRKNFNKNCSGAEVT